MTQATMARPRVPRRTFPPVPLVVLVVTGALLCAAMTAALRNPRVVPRVTVDNPNAVTVNVSVRASTGGSRLILTTVPPHGRVDNLDVLDQGDEWIFAFSTGGVDGGTMRVRQADLAADGWHVAIPESVAHRLQTGRFVPGYRG